MSRTVTITIDKTEETKRFMSSTWKHGRAVEQPQMAKQSYNLQADTEETADYTIVDALYERWLGVAVTQVSEYVAHDPSTSSGVTTIQLVMPGNWASNRHAVQYAMTELIHNGMMSDWYDDVKPDSAAVFKKKAELNKAEIRSMIYSLNPPM